MKGESVANESTAKRALECLHSLALEKGLDDVSMRDVAKRVGISLAALQYHYPNKAALFAAFVEHAVQSYRHQIEAMLAQTAKGDRFASLIRFVANETLSFNQHSMLAMIEGRANHDDAAKSAILLFFRSYLDLMRQALISDQPDIKTEKALVVAALTVSMLEGLPSVIEAADQMGIDRDLLLEFAVKLAQSLPEFDHLKVAGGDQLISKPCCTSLSK